MTTTNRYARYLGIDPVADHDLLWVAVEAREKEEGGGRQGWG